MSLFSVKVRPFTTPTVTGSLLIANPIADAKAAMVVLFGHVAASVDTETANAVYCIGLTDGTNSRYMAGTAQNGVDPGNSYRSQGSNHLLRHISTAGASSLVGDLVSLDATGLTINFTTVPGAALDGFVVFWNGADVEAYVGDTGDLGAADNITTVITAPGFRMENMIMMGAEVPVDGAIYADFAYSLSIGCVDNLGTDNNVYLPPYPPIWPNWTQVVTSFTVADGASKGGAFSQGWSSLANFRKDGSRFYVAYLSDVSDVGFSMTTVFNAHNAVASYLALKLSNGAENGGFQMTRNPGILDLTGFREGPSGTGVMELDQVGGAGDTYAVICLNTGSSFLDNHAFSSGATTNPQGIGVSAFDMDGRSAAANLRVKWMNNGTPTETACIQTDDAIRLDPGANNALYTSAVFDSYALGSLQVNFTTFHDQDPANLISPSFGYIQYAELASADEDPVPVDIGGTNLWLDTDETAEVLARGSFLAKTGTGSEIELGPFRYAEQKQADETSMVSSLIIGLTEADNGAVLSIDWNTGLITFANGDTDTDTTDEDWGDIGGTEDIYEDWGLGYGDPDSFGLELMASDDGLTPQHQGAETLEPTEELGSSRQYAPAGISGIFHRIKLTATDAGERFYVKFVDIAGALTGRKR